MSIQFIIGSAKENHAVCLLDHAENWLAASSEHEVFYVVPNHVKFETEVSVLNQLRNFETTSQFTNVASTRLQVFSFSRLAWYFMQYTEDYQKRQLSDAGKQMLLKQALLACEDDIQLYRYELNKAGFIQQLIEIFDELQLGDITVLDFEHVVTQLRVDQKESDAAEKLAELNLIYRAYLAEIASANGETEDIKLRLARYLSTKNLKNVMFIISGFSSLTAVEKQLLEVLAKVGGEMKVSLVLNQAYPLNPPEPFDLFYHPGKVYFELYTLATQNRVPVMTDVLLQTETMENLLKIDEAWQDSQKLTVTHETFPLEKEHLLIRACEDPYGEVVRVAKYIRQLVATKNYRYRDILVLTRDLPKYQKIIEPVFKRNDIPFYLNEENQMKHHPLIEWVTTLFRLKSNYYHHHDLMRFLRTELFNPDVDENQSLAEWEQAQQDYRKAVDYTENVVLASGFKGYDWLREEDWKYYTYHAIDEDESSHDAMMQRVSNEVRRDIRMQIPVFFSNFEKAATYAEACQLFYSFLESSGVSYQLRQMRNQAIEDGDLVAAKNHEHIWQELMNLLDEFVELLGEHPFDFDSFEQTLLSGLEGVTFRKVPATVDQLMVSSVDFVQAEKKKVTIIIGVTDQQFPKKVENKSLLSDEERSIFRDYLMADKFLKKDARTDYLREPYVFYLALLSATDQVLLTYPRQIDQVKDLKPSHYLTLLTQKLALEIEEWSTVPSLKSLDQLAHFSTNEMVLRDFISLKQRLVEENLPLSWLWQQLEKRLHKFLPLRTARVLDSLTYLNTPENLNDASVEALYGDTLHASISTIEGFYNCQYRYFLQHGLHLKERSVYELSPAAAGDFYHEVLDAFFKSLIQSKLQLSDLSDAEVKELADRVLRTTLDDHRFGILDTSARMAYIKYQLEKTIHRVSWSLRRQSERSGMTTIQTELLFGEAWEKIGIAGFNFDLQNQKKLKVRGKIDRIDAMKVGQDDYLSVIDYKSSKHQFNFVDAYYGLALQMITYLNVALRNAEKLVKNADAKAAGAFYLHVQNPVLTGVTSKDEEVLADEMLKEFRLDGLLVDDESMVTQLDRSLEPGESSLVYPYKQLKSEALRSTNYYSNEELDWLLKDNENKFKEAGEAIFSGSTKLNPAYKDQQRVACTYCPYRSVCQFDVMLKDNQYHRLNKVTKEEVIGEKQSEEDDHGPANKA